MVMVYLLRAWAVCTGTTEDHPSKLKLKGNSGCKHLCLRIDHDLSQLLVQNSILTALISFRA